ncbi:PREDICTED: uncharacterized protein LOC105570923, partial [Vollenhovia emeryi]|uniref:uncharacterized protein LOC105570923 n=1 Tax=Vollenhovia emeryi TaxID=411798 RepID=UPI0005F41B59
EWGGLSFRMTQVMKGHGCFGHFLGRIGQEQDSRCHHCSAADDTAQHTLGECPAWADKREALVRVIGQDLSLPAVITAILEEERSWHAFASFCEKVISQKEAAEREKRGQIPLPRPPQHRRRRRWARGRLPR